MNRSFYTTTTNQTWPIMNPYINPLGSNTTIPSGYPTTFPNNISSSSNDQRLLSMEVTLKVLTQELFNLRERMDDLFKILEDIAERY